ncbi:D-glycero-beta-D-manno-heptose-7-phosphate kinase, partial [Pseudomonas sp. MWU12-2534b]
MSIPSRFPVVDRTMTTLRDVVQVPREQLARSRVLVVG